MVEKQANLYESLLRIALDKEKLHASGIPTSIIKSSSIRTEGNNVFEEGQLFAGNVKQALYSGINPG